MWPLKLRAMQSLPSFPALSHPTVLLPSTFQPLWFSFVSLEAQGSSYFRSFGHLFSHLVNCFLSLFSDFTRSWLLHAGFLQLRQAGATPCCRVQASHCTCFSCCRAWALGTWASVPAACRLRIVAHGLQSSSLVVVAHRLSGCEACGIFPDQGLNLCLLHWQVDS